MNEEKTVSQQDQIRLRIGRAELKAEQCQIEGAIYREELMRIKKLADSAREVNSGSILNQISREARSTLESDTMDQWCKDWKASWESDLAWLTDTLKIMKGIRSIASQRSVMSDQPDASLKRILQLADSALIQRSSNVPADTL